VSISERRKMLKLLRNVVNDKTEVLIKEYKEKEENGET
jgi:hypothetical protein